MLYMTCVCVCVCVYIYIDVNTRIRERQKKRYENLKKKIQNFLKPATGGYIIPSILYIYRYYYILAST